ncbi:MAG: ergothioneine biosynthesis protein EgtB [Prochlorotrichaceae cyanobacterium]
MVLSLATPSPLTDTLRRDRYRAVRQWSEQICKPLETEDYVIQTMPDVSPPKWHLAHTTWFFETFILQPFLADYRLFHDRYNYLFNSYYEAVGDRHPRPQRGLLARPTVADIYAYRAYVDQAMEKLLDQAPDPTIDDLVTLGLHHEQQHQELLLTDIKHIFATNPLYPVYQQPDSKPDQPAKNRTIAAETEALHWQTYPGGLYEVGHDPNQGFAFDNESPQHRVYLHPFALADRLVTCGEYLAFIEAGGYQTASYWLSEGWHRIQTEGWQAPLYWHKREGEWWIMTLQGLKPLCLAEPVSHVSYFEADAYATWAGYRLPSEAEWEAAALTASPSSLPFPEPNDPLPLIHPQPLGAAPSPGLQQLQQTLWQWTQSAYLPYPGFRTLPGAIGEYNGKFMCNQMVLRGGSCATPPVHLRLTYRNFFPPESRWQFSGIRLAAN